MPFRDDWTLKWENTNSIDDSYSSAIELKYKVEISNQPPIASIKANVTNGSAPLTIMFTGEGIDYDGVINSYFWNFGEGNSSNMKNPTFTFKNVGTYIVTLTITDDYGGTGENSLFIKVNDL